MSMRVILAQQQVCIHRDPTPPTPADIVLVKLEGPPGPSFTQLGLASWRIRSLQCTYGRCDPQTWESATTSVLKKMAAELP